MDDFSFSYKIIPLISWTFLSSLLMIALYFKFNRFWSVRNLDLVLIVLLAPGLLMVSKGGKIQKQILKESKLTAEAAGEQSTESSLVAVKDGSSDLVDPPILPEPDVLDEIDAGAAELPVNLQAKFNRARQLERNGFIALFLIAGVFAVRMLIDPMMVRRPMLEPNLSISGLTFLGVSLLLFLILNVVGSKPTTEDMYGFRSARNMLERTAVESDRKLQKLGPGYALVFLLPTFPTFVADQQEQDTQHLHAHEIRQGEVLAAKIMAILCQLATVAGIFYIGYMHFDNARMGVGIATLYLMLPYTAEMTGRVEHILPAALLVWAVALYRRPWASGTFVGLAMGVFYYPIFLLPLWLSFYWRRGRWRFLGGVGSMLATLAFSLLFVSEDFSAYLGHLSQMFGIWTPRMDGLQGIWNGGPFSWDSVYRLPILAGFVVLSIAFALWPAQKNLGTLICCSCALMAFVQFWHGYGGGLLMGWYLPLGLLAIFRPNLDDRVALTVLGRTKRKQKN